MSGTGSARKPRDVEDGSPDAPQDSRDVTLQWLFHQLNDLEARLERIENSFLFRCFRAAGRFAQVQKRRCGQLLLHSFLHPLYLRVARPPDHLPAYRRWLAQTSARLPSPEWHSAQAARWSRRPSISVVMAVHNPRLEWLDQAIRSVAGQTYPRWQLCLCDDMSSDESVRRYLAEQARQDSRICLVSCDSPLGISGALNRALEQATGDYVAFLDHDDFLSPFALHYIVEALQQQDPDLLYSDEDHVNEAGEAVRPLFKPGWSPELLSTCMYLGHFLVVSRKKLEQVGRFRSEFDGSQDYDLALRMTDGHAKVVHISRVLYHWRQHAASTAKTPEAKPYTWAAGRRALEDAVQRRGWEAEVVYGALPNTFLTRHRLRQQQLVSIIICSRNSRLLRRCLASVREKTAHPPIELIVVHHETGRAKADQAVRSVVAEFQCRQLTFQESFNFSRMNNLAAQTSTGELLVFLNDDVQPLHPDWLIHLAAQLQRPDSGIVGARLLYPGGALQHAGIAVGMLDGVGHPGRGLFGNDYWNWLNHTRNVTAVTGACLGIRRGVFEQLGGFDPAFAVNYNDVDLCLRARQAGYEVIVDSAVLQHHECRTRRPGTRLQERHLFFSRWRRMLDAPDPYYSPHLRRDTEEPSLPQ